ncbi:CMF_collapsed_G0013110.mRNA.1.CDS.1 [Saccharomyces cerevisiae]|nr:CMF_collapsed_G0013110.mRNA.1.CDS.1 [Saccharomyces cerevisiae]
MGELIASFQAFRDPKLVCLYPVLSRCLNTSLMPSLLQQYFECPRDLGVALSFKINDFDSSYVSKRAEEQKLIPFAY